jgi:uncharacterized protein (DUF885 family)
MKSVAGPKTGAGDGFRTFLEEDWLRWLSDYPQLGTMCGHPGFNDRWVDDSPQGVERRRAHLRESRVQLLRFVPTQLSPADRLDQALYLQLLTTAEEGVTFGYDPLPFDFGEPHDLRMPMNQLEGIHITAADMLDAAPRDRLSDYDDRLSRLRALPTAIRQERALLEAGRVAGVTPPRVALAGLPDEIRSLLPADLGASPLLESFHHLPAVIGPSEASRLARETREVYSDSVAPAWQELLDYLTSRYLPDCRETIGASALPHGPEAYAYLVRRMTTTDLTPEQIHEVGLREVRRVRAEMDSLMATTGFRGEFTEFKEFLRTEPRFFMSRAEELVDAYRALAKKIDPQLGRLFRRLPRLPYGVEPVPSSREKSSPAAYYLGGAPETGRPGTFYINTYRVPIRPRWEMEDLCLHEAVPGHHLQIALAQELDHLPSFRRWSGPTAFIEGWGLYAESLGEELGLYTDPYSKMGQLIADAWRSIRLVVDTGMHALGWTRDRAIQFFRENTALSDVGITVEVDRYIVWPAQALGYKMGQLKIREMRTYAERRLGERFDVRAFHDLVLGEGALSLAELERRVRFWADRLPAG